MFLKKKKKNLRGQSTCFWLHLISSEFELVVEIRVPGVHLIESPVNIKLAPSRGDSTRSLGISRRGREVPEKTEI